MKKIIAIFCVILFAALVVVMVLQVTSAKTKPAEAKSTNPSQHVKSSVVTESGETVVKKTTDPATLTSDEPEIQPKWVKSDAPIKFPILMYHHIADVVGGNTLFVPASEFKMEMAALKKAGYYTLSPKEAYRVLTTNEKPADKIVWVTFDDGYKNAHDTAMPILTELGMKASFFIITGMVGDEDKMTASGLLALQSNPLMSLESHTVTHPDLQYAAPAVATKELTESKSYLDQLLHQDTSVICYPSGRYNDQTADLATAAGYKLGLTTEPGLASSMDGLFALKRVRVAYGQTASSFMSLIGDR